MNDREVAAVLALFAGAYPWAEVTSEQTRAWVTTLEGDSADGAEQAAREWVGVQKRPPTIAEFRETARAIRWRNRPQENLELVEPVITDKARRLANIAEARRVLAAAGTLDLRLPADVIIEAKAEREQDPKRRPIPAHERACPYCGTGDFSKCNPNAMAAEALKLERAKKPKRKKARQ